MSVRIKYKVMGLKGFLSRGLIKADVWMYVCV